MSRTAAEIKAEACEIQRQIDELRELRFKLRKELRQVLLDKCEVKIGEIVMAKPPERLSVFTEAIVRDIDNLDFDCEIPWLKVSFRKKDGQWSQRECNVYNHWKKKTD